MENKYLYIILIAGVIIVMTLPNFSQTFTVLPAGQSRFNQDCTFITNVDSSANYKDTAGWIYLKDTANGIDNGYKEDGLNTIITTQPTSRFLTNIKTVEGYDIYQSTLYANRIHIDMPGTSMDPFYIISTDPAIIKSCVQPTCNTDADYNCDGKVKSPELVQYSSVWTSNPTQANRNLLGGAITAWINTRNS